MLTNCAFQLSFGKFYTFYSVKTVFITAIALFEIGSVICGVAPNSTAFIVGRAIAGVGSAGIMSGAITVIVYAVPLHKRPMFQGLFGAVFGIASVVGPLLGGAFTSNVTWRWCFYINLPFGGIAMVFIFFLLQIPDRETTHLPNRQKLAQLDSLGLLFLLPGVICLLLALQWGGSKYAWNNGRIIALLVLAGILSIGFVLVQIFKPDTATVPPRIFKQRSILAGAWATFTLGSSMMVVVYYLPIWFQAIEHVSAVQSGIRLLPMVLPMVLASILTGVLTARIGYYTPFMIFGTVLLSIGSGLLTTLQVNTSEGKWFGYQILVSRLCSLRFTVPPSIQEHGKLTNAFFPQQYGFGMGCTFQGPNLAAQTVLPTVDVPIGTSIMFFSQLLGGAIFISVASNVLDNELIKRLAGIPGVNPRQILSEGATSLLEGVPEGSIGAVLAAYNESLRTVFKIGLVMACVVILGAASMEWRSVKSKKEAADEKRKSQQQAADVEAAGAEKKEVDTRSVETTSAGMHDDGESSGEDHTMDRTNFAKNEPITKAV